MVALPKLGHGATAPTTAPKPEERHLRLVPPPESPHVPGEEARHVSAARWMAVLIAAATGVFLALWTAAMLGAADETWWWPLLAVVMAGMVALGVVVIRRSS